MRGIYKIILQLILILSIGTSGMYTLVWNCVMIEEGNKELCLVRIIMSIITIVWTLRNMYNFEILK